MTRVLVVDDEAPIRRAMAANLHARGYEVDLADTGEEALELAARHHPDVVLLDLGLPGMDGLDVIDGLRGWSQVPIVVLSARGSERDKVGALDAGADDYVSKPFGMDELLARLRAAVRRGPAGDGEAVVSTDHFAIDLSAKRVLDPTGQPLRLTPTEWHLLEVLVRNSGKLVSQRQLLQEVWGPAYGDESNYLRVHMAHLRHKLEPDRTRPRYLITEPGMGYRFVAPPPAFCPDGRTATDRPNGVRRQRRGVWMAVCVIRWIGPAVAVDRHVEGDEAVALAGELVEHNGAHLDRLPSARTPSRETSEETWIHGPSSTLRARIGVGEPQQPAGVGDRGTYSGRASRTSARYAAASPASNTSVSVPSTVPGRSESGDAGGRSTGSGRGARARAVVLEPCPWSLGAVAQTVPAASMTARSSAVAGLVGRDRHDMSVVDRLAEAGRDRAVAEPLETPPLGGDVGEVGVHIDTGHEATTEPVRPGDVVVVDLVRRLRRRVVRLDHVRGPTHTMTPGLRTPAGSSSALTLVRARPNAAGRWRRYHGSWSRPTAWWWVIVPPAASSTSEAAALISSHMASSDPIRPGAVIEKYGAGPSG